MRAPHTELPTIAADLLDRLRAQRPRVHCITNSVAQAFTANVLLAAGAVPSMTVDPEEIADFVAGADALLVNLGTLDPERRQATGIAVEVATSKRKPWVLDPVFIDRTPRRAAARAGAGRARADGDPLQPRRIRNTCRCGGGTRSPRHLRARSRHGGRGHRRLRSRHRRIATCGHRQRRSDDGAHHRDGLRGLGLGRRSACCRATMPGQRLLRRCCGSALPAMWRHGLRPGPARSPSPCSMCLHRLDAETLITHARIT